MKKEMHSNAIFPVNWHNKLGARKQNRQNVSAKGVIPLSQIK